MIAVRRSRNHRNARGPGHHDSHGRRRLGLLVALFASLCAFALPAAPAFGEGSADLNTGPGTAFRNGLQGTAIGSGVLHVYAQAGETIQLASSAIGSGSGNILLHAPGVNPVTGTPVWDCTANDPGTGRIGTTADPRAEELAGPQPSADPDAYAACEYTVPAGGDGIYSVRFVGPVPGGPNGGMGTVDAPVTSIDQGINISIWDITVRDAGGAVADGRAFWNVLSHKTQLGGGSTVPQPATNVRAYAYTKTGYEYQVDLFDHGGVNWTFAADDQGVIDTATGDRVFASTPFTAPVDVPAVRTGDLGDTDFRHPLSYNRLAPVVITGPGGLAATRGFSDTPISPASNPLANPAFTGPAGQAGATNRGSTGTISFTSPAAMEGLDYTVAIDTDRNGTFGGGTDFVNASGDLSASGSNTFAWSGRDAAGNVPACGDYQYQVRSSLSEVHFTMSDVENSGGTRIERLSLPGDPALGNVLAAYYNDINPYPPGGPVTNTSPPTATPGTSGDGFHRWTNDSGNEAYVDTWTRLPEVQATGTLRLLCPDVEIVKSSTAPLVAGERGTYRLTMINHGPGTAVNAKASDKLPSGVTFVSASTGCSQAGGTVTCTTASLAEGASETFTVTVDVDSSANGCEDVRNTATVTNETGPDPEPSNNTSTICNFEKRADLSLSKLESSATVAPGGQVMYTMVVKNNGPSDEPKAVVKDPVPAGLTLVSAEAAQGSCSIAGGDLSCNLGSLRSGGSTQILVTATLTATGCVTNTARVSGDAFDPKLANNVDDARVCPEGIDPKFDLVVSKSVNKRKPRVGETVRYRVVVTNRGPDAAPSVTVKDTLNAPVRVVSVKPSQGSCTKRIPMTCELGTIPAGGRVTITIRAKHREPVSGDCSRRGQRNAASATGDGTDTNPANNLDVVRVCPKVELKLTKKVSAGAVRAGQTFSYTIRVSNPSKVAVRRVRTCDDLPAGLVYVSSKSRAKLSKGRYCWTAKRLRAGQSKTYKITVRALSGTSGRKVNRASATSPNARTSQVRRPVVIPAPPPNPPDPITG